MNQPNSRPKLRTLERTTNKIDKSFETTKADFEDMTIHALGDVKKLLTSLKNYTAFVEAKFDFINNVFTELQKRSETQPITSIAKTSFDESE